MGLLIALYSLSQKDIDLQADLLRQKFISQSRSAEVLSYPVDVSDFKKPILRGFAGWPKMGEIVTFRKMEDKPNRLIEQRVFNNLLPSMLRKNDAVIMKNYILTRVAQGVALGKNEDVLILESNQFYFADISIFLQSSGKLTVIEKVETDTYLEFSKKYHNFIVVDIMDNPDAVHSRIYDAVFMKISGL